MRLRNGERADFHNLPLSMMDEIPFQMAKIVLRSQRKVKVARTLRWFLFIYAHNGTVAIQKRRSSLHFTYCLASLIIGEIVCEMTKQTHNEDIIHHRCPLRSLHNDRQLSSSLTTRCIDRTSSPSFPPKDLDSRQTSSGTRACHK